MKDDCEIAHKFLDQIWFILPRLEFTIWGGATPIRQYTGAILANGRGGRETTIWTEQKYCFYKKCYFMFSNQSREKI